MNLKVLFVGLAIAMSLVGCNQDEMVGMEPTMVTLKANLDNNESSRVGFESGTGNFYWTNGDIIGVTVNGGTIFLPMNLTDGAETASATFTASLSGNPLGYAVYPYINLNNHKIDEDGTLTYKLPTSYTYTSVDSDYGTKSGNSFNAPMWAKINEGESLSFQHLGGVFSIAIGDLKENTSYKVSFTASNKITGEFTAELTGTTPKLTTQASDVENVVTIDFTTAANQTQVVVYIPMPTGMYETLIAEVVDADGKNAGMGVWQNKEITLRKLMRAKIGQVVIQGGETPTVNTADALMEALQAGGNITLSAPITLTEGVTISNEVTLNLNGQMLSYTGDDVIFRVDEGGNLTINGGVNGSKIYTDPTTPSSGGNGYVALVKTGGTVTFNGGEYVLAETCTVAQSSGGQINVNAGVFDAQKEGSYARGTYTFNCKDEYAAVGKISISGGTFKYFDPARNSAENPKISFVAEGYVSYQSDENTWTVVEAENEIEVNSATNLINVMAQGGKVKLISDVTVNGTEYPAPATGSSYYFTKTASLDLNGYTLTYTGNDVIFRIDNGGEILINGLTSGSKIYTNPTTPSSGGNGYVALVKTGGTVTFNGGEYVLAETCTVAQSTGGQVNVMAGVFDAQKEGSYARGTYTFNCLDEYAEVGKISISGGTFKYFDPARNSAENPKISFVAEGYVSYESAANEWTVVSSTETIEVSSAAALEDVLTQGGKVKLTSNLNATKTFVVPSGVNATIDLNGKTLMVTGSGIDAIKVEDGELTINGNSGSVIADGGYAIWARNGGKVTINGGTFDALVNGNSTIYASNTVEGEKSEINITSGTFKSSAGLYDGRIWTLNCDDTSYANGTAVIKVTGGDFINFNPSEPRTETGYTGNFVVDGYKAVSATENGITTYTIVEE